MRRYSAVILAAGASSRLGQPKQLLKIDSETLVERSVRVAVEAGCSPVFVVLGAYAELIQAGSTLVGARVLLNEAWQEGMASSIRLGVAALPSNDGVVIMTCDMPAVSKSHIYALVQSGRVTATSYGGRRGVPAYFPESIYSTLVGLQGDAGARNLLKTASAIELIGGELDIDTEEDLKSARKQYGQF